MGDQGKPEDLVTYLAAAVRASGLYSPSHPLARRQVDRLQAVLTDLLGGAASLTLAVVGTDVVVGRTRIKPALAQAWVARHLRERQIEKLTLSRELRRPGLEAVVNALADRDPVLSAHRLALLASHGVSLATIATDEGAVGFAGIAAAREVYGTAVGVAESLWGAASSGQGPDPHAAHLIVDMLARGLTRDGASLMALTTLQAHDAYTCTHMVNVAMLTMVQARALGISGPLLREFGLAGLMHDIGKVKTPQEILNKPDRLTTEETAIMHRHVIDGAQILRQTPEIPALAPLAAFEHHLKCDLGGYPAGAGARSLNLCTMLVMIADGYDALRAKRLYRDAVPSVRVRKLLGDHSGTAFEPTLLKRFISLVGIFPVGTGVRLKTGELAVVTDEHPTEASRPVVRVVCTAAGQRAETTVVIDTAVHDQHGRHPYSVLEAIDVDELGRDPLEAMA